MFTRDALIAGLPGLLAAAPLPLELVEFSYNEFDPPASEQTIQAMRGGKSNCDSGMRFWVDAVRAQNWVGRESYIVEYLQSSLCTPIEQFEFAQIVNECSWSLLKPLPPYLTDLGGFQAGLRMDHEWHDDAVIAELSDSFIAFFWWTTA